MNFIVDCESSGGCPQFGDLIEFAAIAENGQSFKSEKFPPLCGIYEDGAYQVLGINREIHHSYHGDVKAEFQRFHDWVKETACKGKRGIFWSDNPAFDWQWINWGFYYAGLKNPFGFSARRIGDLFAGANGNFRDSTSWKKWRRTKHTHDPLDDVRGNLEALLTIRSKFNL